MTHLFKIITLSACLFISSSCLAGNVDLVVNISPDIFSNLSAGDVHEFTVSVTNHGPDTAGIDSVLSYPVSVYTNITLHPNSLATSIQINTDSDQNCFLLTTIAEPRPPATQVQIFKSFHFPLIHPNTTVTCVGFFETFYVYGVRSLEWQISNPTDVDLDSSNNAALLTFGGTPQPVPLSVQSCLALLFLLLFLGIRSIKHN